MSDERAIDCHEHQPEVCRLADVATTKEGTDPKFIEDCEAYFSHFARPIKREKSGELICFHCGEILTGFLSMIGRGGFQWGIAHGEGFCANCKWPARAYHFAKDSDGKELFTLHGAVMQYMPEFVEKRKASEAA